MKRIKVAHLTSAHKDGDVRIFHKECVSLSQAGFEVIHIVPNTERRVEKGIQIEPVFYEHKSKRDRIRNTVKLVYQKAVEVDADIYHIHDPELLRIGLKLRKKGKKVIYDAHEDTPRQILSRGYLNGFLRSILSFGFEWFENYTSKRMSAIVTATPYINERFLKINSKSVNINNFPLNSEIEVAEPDFDKREHKVCYIGGISWARGIKQMVIGAEKAGIPIRIAGNWSENTKQEITKLSGWSNVDSLGHISRDTALDVKATSIAGLVLFLNEPNHINAQPNKMFEYMAAELPVIGSDFPLWRSIIIDNKCGLCVDPEDTDAIAEAINYIVNNPEEAKQMGKNGKAAVKAHYNWNVEQKKLIELYESLS